MKARVIPAAFVLAVFSICLTYYFSTEMLMAFPIFVCIMCLIFKYVFKRKIAIILLGCLWIMLFSGYTLQKTDYTASVLNSYIDRECMVYGKIIYEGGKNEFFESYTIKIDKLADKNGKNKIEADEKTDFSVRVNEKNIDLHYGDYICTKAEISLVEGADNTGEADFSLIKSAESIFYSITAEESDIKILYAFEKISDLDDFAHVSRQYVHDIADKMLSKENSAFTTAILVSDKEHLNDDTLRMLENAGLMHLGAASGLHVGCIITLITFLFGMLYVKRKSAVIIAMPMIIIYIIINGGSVSVIRAAVMAFLVVAAEFFSRDADLITDLCLAGIILITVNPLCIFSAGFVLSFASVAAIAIFTGDILKIFNKIPKRKLRGNEAKIRLISSVVRYVKATASVCIAVQIIIMPLCAYYFEYVPVYSVLSNLLISWVLPFFMMSAFLMLVFGFFEPLCKVFAFFTEVISDSILGIMRVIASLPCARTEWFITAVVVLIFIALPLAIHYFFKKKTALAMLFGTICIFSITINVYSGISEFGAVRVSFVNVGQADGCMIKINGSEAVIVDGGGKAGSDEDKVFVPYLKRSGVKKVKYIFISHYDSDHVKNVLHVLDEFEVENLVLPVRAHEVEYKTVIENKANEKNCNIIYTKNGDCVEVSENIKAFIYAPTKFSARLKEENRACMAMKMVIEDKNILFLGDLEEDVQRAMSEKYKEELKCDIVKIAHHGAKDSYCRELMDYAKPRMAVISCGKDNIYNHPDDRVVFNLARRNVRTFITSRQGDITFYIRKNKMTEISCYKQ